jgi:thioredoxin 1
MENETQPEEPESKSHLAGKVTILIVLAMAIASVLYLKTRSKAPVAPGSASSETEPGPESIPVELPRLIDLGADKCIPCKMMAPILEELKEEYKEVFEVMFIDVWKDPQPGKRYKIRVIPTQIFLDGSGKELFRHEGFYSREDILNKWAELGIEVQEQ